ncbi:hypothetical protein T492DRAFT_946295 [Pavlovales sp. CCMP2436]|nr:hypothetical protein T492DRAFT_946295 [Pavlovales sp. CCMP2436]|mmetsp:Transcript_7865/g.20662  ORF Transcript_7865/g.20662 Transcript_7865/m.20662 type:complete len:137 (-) Transcript_7865:107-517(-)
MTEMEFMEDAEHVDDEPEALAVRSSGGMHFCPRDGALLMVESHDGAMRLFCQLCPYTYRVVRPITYNMELPRKQVDDVMGGAEAWENVDHTEVVCPKCQNTQAYFFQLQIRSADEPMTTFYKCTNSSCGNRWKDNG